MDLLRIKSNSHPHVKNNLESSENKNTGTCKDYDDDIRNPNVSGELATRDAWRMNTLDERNDGIVNAFNQSDEVCKVIADIDRRGKTAEIITAKKSNSLHDEDVSLDEKSSQISRRFSSADCERFLKYYEQFNLQKMRYRSK